MTIYQTYKQSLVCKLIHVVVLVSFATGLIVPPQKAYGQVGALPGLPLPGVMVTPSLPFAPPLLKGIKVDPDNPFKFDFLVTTGDVNIGDLELRKESKEMIKYFLTSLTIPEEDLWVNLSPYEQDRIIPNEFGSTAMGRDLLSQDYILKQLTASLIYPEGELGKKFWERVRQKAHKLYGTTDVPMSTFNKVWIVPDRAVIYAKGNVAFVKESRLKVMMEEDYEAAYHNKANLDKASLSPEQLGTTINEANTTAENKDRSTLSSQILKELIIPEIEREVNEGENFTQLRQIYSSFLLAVWFKKMLRKSLVGQVYVDQKKIKGVEVDDLTIKQKIYDQYIEAYKKGVYNYIREDYDPQTKESIPRKYFSGGVGLTGKQAEITDDPAMNVPDHPLAVVQVALEIDKRTGEEKEAEDSAMATSKVGISNVFRGLTNLYGSMSMSVNEIAEDLRVPPEDIPPHLDNLIRLDMVESVDGPQETEYRLKRDLDNFSIALSDALQVVSTLPNEQESFQRIKEIVANLRASWVYRIFYSQYIPYYTFEYLRLFFENIEGANHNLDRHKDVLSNVFWRVMKIELNSIGIENEEELGSILFEETADILKKERLFEEFEKALPLFRRLMGERLAAEVVQEGADAGHSYEYYRRLTKYLRYMNVAEHSGLKKESEEIASRLEDGFWGTNRYHLFQPEDFFFMKKPALRTPQEIEEANDLLDAIRQFGKNLLIQRVQNILTVRFGEENIHLRVYNLIEGVESYTVNKAFASIVSLSPDPGYFIIIGEKLEMKLEKVLEVDRNIVAHAAGGGAYWTMINQTKEALKQINQPRRIPELSDLGYAAFVAMRVAGDLMRPELSSFQHLGDVEMYLQEFEKLIADTKYLQRLLEEVEDQFPKKFKEGSLLSSELGHYVLNQIVSPRMSEIPVLDKGVEEIYDAFAQTYIGGYMPKPHVIHMRIFDLLKRLSLQEVDQLAREYLKGEELKEYQSQRARGVSKVNLLNSSDTLRRRIENQTRLQLPPASVETEDAAVVSQSSDFQQGGIALKTDIKMEGKETDFNFPVLDSVCLDQDVSSSLPAGCDPQLVAQYRQFTQNFNGFNEIRILKITELPAEELSAFFNSTPAPKSFDGG